MRQQVKRPRGFTLVELLVAIAILAIGMMAAWHSIDAARHSIGNQLVRVLAHEAALNRAAELRLMGMAAAKALPSEVVQGPYKLAVRMTGTAARAGLVEVEILVSTADRPGARVIAVVPK